MKVEDIASSSSEHLLNLYRGVAREYFKSRMVLGAISKGIIDYLNIIDLAYTSIEKRNEEIKRLEELNRQDKELINEAVNCMADITSRNGDNQLLINYLYWGFSEVKRGSIKLLEGKPEDIVITVEYTCKDCGKHQERYHRVGSRSKLQRELQFIKDAYSRGSTWGEHSVICEDCRKKRSEETGRISRIKQFRYEERLSELKTMPYYEYLQTDEWKNTRKRALRRAGFKCELCNSDGELHVHHKTYERRGDEDNDDLIVLCKNCHAKFHDKLSKEGVSR